MSAENHKNCFNLGLTLAGAVSAGAYSAGVLEFLREALEAWETARNQDGKDCNGNEVPMHRVQIQAISGTSAGAMCAAMFIGGLDKPLQPIASATPAEGNNPYNPLYYAWVDRVDIQPMLDDDDLVREAAVKSLLNCRILDQIASEVLNPWRPDYVLQPWIADDAEVFLCTTSLRGIPYAVKAFPNDPNPYGMSLHAGVLKYRLRTTTRTPNADAITLAPDLDDATKANNWDNLRSAALASGAFPFALKARQTETPLGVVESRFWEIPTTEGRNNANNVVSELPASTDPFRAVCVDGGAINNEPVEHARLALTLRARAAAPNEDIPRLKRELAKCNAATILIDPFPDRVEFSPSYAASDDVFSVAKALLPAVLNQLRFKSDELILAASSAVGSRYLISPSRPWRKRKEPTLACGAIGGFLGFLKKDFRHHDYLLGRLNCQQFLKRHFYVSDENELVNPWLRSAQQYVGANYYSDADLKNIRAAHPEIDKSNKPLNPVPIIPLMPQLQDENMLLATLNSGWPSAFTDEDMDILHRRLRNRLDAVLTRLLTQVELPIAKRLARWMLSGMATLLGVNPATIAAEKISERIREVLFDAKLLKK